MPNPKPDPNKSRIYPRTYTGVEWAAILALLKRGLTTVGESPGTREGREAQLVRKLLPDLEDTVGILRELEPLGCGLDHPDWRELV